MIGLPLTEGLAEARLRRMVEASTTPQLSNEDVLDLLELSKVADAERRLPTAEGWVPTWYLARGAAEGWRLKAGKAAGMVDASADGGSLKRSQLHAHCLAMVRVYSRQGGLVATPLQAMSAAHLRDPGVINRAEDDDEATPSRGGAVR